MVTELWLPNIRNETILITFHWVNNTCKNSNSDSEDCFAFFIYTRDAGNLQISLKGPGIKENWFRPEKILNDVSKSQKLIFPKEFTRDFGKQKIYNLRLCKFSFPGT